jgi:hypothetical protein
MKLTIQTNQDVKHGCGIGETNLKMMGSHPIEYILDRLRFGLSPVAFIAGKKSKYTEQY